MGKASPRRLHSLYWRKKKKPEGFMGKASPRRLHSLYWRKKKNQKGLWEKQALEDCTLCTEERRKTRRVYGSYEHHYVLRLADQVLLQHEYWRKWRWRIRNFRSESDMRRSKKKNCLSSEESKHEKSSLRMTRTRNQSLPAPRNWV
jgi:hypothetical protein